MTRTEEFRQGYAPVVDSLDLPDRIALVYRPEACLAERQDRSVWRLRRRCDEAPFVLKIARADGEVKRNIYDSIFFRCQTHFTNNIWQFCFLHM